MALLQLNFATGYETPPYWLTQAEAIGNLYQDALQVKWEEENEWWKIPLDPVVSISGKNTLIRRNALKIDNADNRRGTIKESWSQDDYTIEIAGLLIGQKGSFPERDIRRLRAYCEARKTLLVESQLFSILKITKIAIEDYSIPFTKGVENQMYKIKAYSDDDFELLVKE